MTRHIAYVLWFILTVFIVLPVRVISIVVFSVLITFGAIAMSLRERAQK
jgi:hypothetical protein